MTQNLEKGISDPSVAIHQYYMDIINCMPHIVYWIDLNCELKGSNNNFVTLLGLNDLGDFHGSPYELIKKHCDWPEASVEMMRLDDMTAIFSAKPAHDIEKPPIKLPNNKTLYYSITRTPLFDKQKQVTGLVVILTDISDRKNKEKKTDVAQTSVHSAPLVLHTPPTILMVEDNLIAQKVEQSLLIALGCKVDMAESGEMALSLFEPGKYDIVFMDIGLQDTSGYVVAKKIREKENGSSHHVPIIALTSYQARVVKYDCRDYFMDGVITKPLTNEQAQQLIKHFVYHEDIQVVGLESG